MNELVALLLFPSLIVGLYVLSMVLHLLGGDKLMANCCFACAFGKFFQLIALKWATVAIERMSDPVARQTMAECLLSHRKSIDADEA